MVRSKLYFWLALLLVLTMLAPFPVNGAADASQPVDLQSRLAAKTKPRIILTQVPRVGSFDNLKGKVENADPAQYALAVYIRVGKGWWTKPYWARPVTAIRPDGSWECDITTGGIDEKANTIAVFLIPNGQNPPLRSGQSSLPAKIRKVSMAKIKIHRNARK